MRCNRVSTCVVLFFVTTGVLLLAGRPCRADEDHHVEIPPESMHQFPRQEIVLENFEADGHILALGGGGEGVMGRLKGRQVVAIDISARELEGAPDGPLKIVMDARDLKFVDGSFPTAASFFTLMYIEGKDHAQVFREVHRVLAPGGRFLIWDGILGPPPGEKIEYGVFSLDIRLPGADVSTGYGVRWPDRPHDVAYYRTLAVEAGFTVDRAETNGAWFYLELRKAG